MAKDKFNSDNVENDFLSMWGNEMLSSSQVPHSESNSEKEEKKQGYVFCRKCYEIVSSTEIKCPKCGHNMSR